MKLKIVTGLALSLGCISAAESPSNFQTYGGIRADADPAVLMVYQQALDRCIPEASSPPRGTFATGSLHYSAALRGCLYRHGFIDRGAYAYPANSLSSGILSR